MQATGLTLGPVLFNWSPDRLRDFYARIADEAPVNTVVLGEVVCSKRPPAVEVLAEAVDRLTRAGKQVLTATLALVMQPRERQSLRDQTAQDDLLVEANDATALSLLGGRPHAVGPHVSIYNEAALAVLAGRGAVRACLGPELPFDTVATLARAARTLPGLALEVLAFGRLPLAISARCYHARAHQLQKDGCQFVCARDPDGLEVDTIDGQSFLAVNGVQVLSGTHANLLSDLPALARAGVSSFRLSPHSGDMVATATLFRDVLDGRMDSEAAQDELADLHPDARFANGFLHGQHGRQWQQGTPEE